MPLLISIVLKTPPRHLSLGEFTICTDFVAKDRGSESRLVFGLVVNIDFVSVNLLPGNFDSIIIEEQNVRSVGQSDSYYG